MSHNKITVGGQSPDSNGEISTELNNLSNVSVSSPSENQLLKYSSGSWTAQTQGAGAFKELVYSYATYVTSGYSGGTTNYSLTNVKLNRFLWRTVSGAIVENGVEGLILQRPTPNNWRNGFEFASIGTYLIFMNLQHYGTGGATWRFYDETNSVYFGPFFKMSKTTDRMPVLVQSLTTTSINQQISLRVTSITTPSAIGTIAEMRAVSINIYKV